MKRQAPYPALAEPSPKCPPFSDLARFSKRSLLPSSPQNLKEATMATTLEPGSYVQLIQGSHLNKYGRVEKLTAKQLYVKIPGVQNLVRKYKTSVKVVKQSPATRSDDENDGNNRKEQSEVAHSPRNEQSASESVSERPRMNRIPFDVDRNGDSEDEWTIVSDASEREKPTSLSPTRVASFDAVGSFNDGSDSQSLEGVGDRQHDNVAISSRTSTPLASPRYVVDSLSRVVSPDTTLIYQGVNGRNEASSNESINAATTIVFDDTFEIASISPRGSDASSMVTAESQMFEDSFSFTEFSMDDLETDDYEHGLPVDGSEHHDVESPRDRDEIPSNITERRQRQQNSYTNSANTSDSAASSTMSESSGAGWRVQGCVSVPHNFGGIEIEKISLLSPGVKSNKHRTFAHYLFGSRLNQVELPIPRSSKKVQEIHVQKEVSWQGRSYHLLSSKLHQESPQNYKYGGPRARVTLQYVAVSGTGLETINLQEELGKIADFASLEPHKAAARLELFESPAATSNIKARSLLILDDLSSSDFEEIPEHCNVGCGFIPRAVIRRLLGNHAVGQRTSAFQVRIFAPRLGVFKGMLQEKDGIDKIQLPSSMRKVPPSTIVGEDWACLLVTKRFPSDDNVKVAKLLAQDSIPESWKDVSRLKPMVPRVWESLGVPRNVSQRYIEEATKPQGLQHAFLGGVADPTNCLPEGHVFAPGMANYQRDTLFVTRCPCIEPEDGFLLPIVTTKPKGMSNASWSALNDIHFGTIIFANSTEGRCSLPETIANGDLDGDLYFVCWNDDIVGNVHPTQMVLKKATAKMTKDVHDAELHHEWLLAAQRQMTDIVAFAALCQLIGKLYTQAIKVAKDSPDGIDDPDCRALGRAYKKALDLGKHGGKLFLPAHLWIKVKPVDLHRYLTSEEEQD